MAPTAKLDNNEELRRLKEVNIDEASARRHVRDSLKDIQLNLDHILFKTPENGIKTKESYEVNSRGIEIFSKSWLPEASSPRALVCFCHGYGDTCTFFFEDPLDRFDRSRPGKLEGPSMGSYVEKAFENHVKKKVAEVLRSKMKAKALMECDQYVSKYAQSATGRTISVVWTCRKQAKELNTCLHQFTNDNVLEEMRREYMLQEEGRPRPYKF